VSVKTASGQRSVAMVISRSSLCHHRVNAVVALRPWGGGVEWTSFIVFTPVQRIYESTLFRRKQMTS